MVSELYREIPIEICTVSGIVALTSFYMLVRLVIKGYQTKTLSDYIMVYLIFASMSTVWCLIPFVAYAMQI